MKRSISDIGENDAKVSRIDSSSAITSRNYRQVCRSVAKGNLYVAEATAACFAAGCVCCAYKLVVQPTGGRSYRPNKRPEECFREKQQLLKGGSSFDLGRGGVYRSLPTGARVLTVGDGDLSFSLALARAVPHLCLVATTHLSREELDAAYGADKIQTVVAELRESFGATVLHSVDATKLHKNAAVCKAAAAAPVAATTTPSSSSGSRSSSAARGGESGTGGDNGGHVPAGFARIVWNFPCIAGQASRDADAQVAEMETNKQLLRRFFRSCAKPGLLFSGAPSTAEGKHDGEKRFASGGNGSIGGGGGGVSLGGGGEVHVSHKAKAPFSHWDIEGCAREGASSKLHHVGALVFDRTSFPGYGAKKVATGAGSFPTWDAKTYLWATTATSTTAAAAAAPHATVQHSKEEEGKEEPGDDDHDDEEKTLDLRRAKLTLELSQGCGVQEEVGQKTQRRPENGKSMVAVARRQPWAPEKQKTGGFGGGSGGGGPVGAMEVPGPFVLPVAGEGVLRLTETFLDGVCAALTLK